MLGLDPALEPFIPSLPSLLDVRPGTPPGRRSTRPGRRRQALDGVQRILLRQSQERPLLLVFEDLHWIDAETQVVFDALVESLPAARILLLVNYRPEYTHGWGGRSCYTQLRIDLLGQAGAEPLLGATYAMNNDTADGITLLERATTQLDVESIGTHIPHVTILGEGYVEAGRLADAGRLAQGALAAARRRKEVGIQAHCLRLLDEVHAAARPPGLTLAEGHFRAALDPAQELGMGPLQAHCHLGLGKLYRRIGRLDGARAEPGGAARVREPGPSPVERSWTAGPCTSLISSPRRTSTSRRAKRPSRRFGHRSNVAVPLLRQGTPIGVISLTAVEPHAFTAERIALLETFAHQAVIAIENARLFEELEQRNHDLSEALEQQTVTSEVLRSVAASPTDLGPVLEAVLEPTRRLCGASPGCRTASTGTDSRPWPRPASLPRPRRTSSSTPAPWVAGASRRPRRRRAGRSGVRVGDASATRWLSEHPGRPAAAPRSLRRHAVPNALV